MSQTKHYRRTILTAENGTGSVNLPYPATAVSNLEVVDGDGKVEVESLSTAGCRLFVSGGVLDGEVTLKFDLTV